MTKDCCQVCVLPLRLPAVCMVSGNLNTTWFDTDFTPTGHGATYGKWYEKKSLHLIFTFYLNSDTSAPELFPVVVLKKKKNPSRWPIYLFTGNESKPPRIVGLWYKDPKWYSYWYILLQTKTRIMTITQHKSVLHAFSVPNWSEICGVVDVFTVPRLSPTGKFRSIYVR